MSKPRPLALSLSLVSLLCSVWLLSPATARAQGATTYGCYIASPPHTLMSPGDVRIVSSPTDCVSGETLISWDVFPVGISPAGVSFDGANVWVSNQGANTITKLRASDGQNLGTFPAGTFPGKSVFDGENIWITNFTTNRLTKIRASDGSPVATIPVRAGPAGLAFDGTNIWASFYGNHSVSKLRLSDGAELDNTTGVFSPLEVLFDGSNIWATNNTGGGKVTKISASTGDILGVFNTNGSFPAPLAFDGSDVWVQNGGSQSLSKVRGSDGTVFGPFATGFGGSGIAFDGTNIWAAADDLVLKFRPADGALLGSFPGSFNGSGRYETAVVFDGTYVWVANYMANTVTRYLDGTLCCDSIAPTTSVAANPAANAAGWNNSDVAISLSASDNIDGSGVKEITYSTTGAQTIAPTTVNGSSVNVSFTGEGESIITYFATDVAGNTETPQSLVIKIDRSAPSVSCDSADGSWHANDVSIPCTANDPVSGLSNAADGSFNLTTNVAANTETANASTDSRTVCDVAGNCVTAGPISGNKVDKKAPTVSITTPSASAVYLLNQAVVASYTCSDGGSGVGSCAGPVANATNIDTASAGAKTFTVNATDQVGNTATPQSVSYSVGYGVVAVYDQTKVHKSGSTVPIKIQIVDSNGVNHSSAALVVQAMSVVLVSANSSGTPEDAGNSNPDLNFRYDASLGGYIFNLKTTGYAAGSYELHFVVAGDTTDHVVQFRIRP